MPCRWKHSRISCACRYSNAAIAQPVWQVLLTPAPVIGRRVEGPERRVVHDRFVGANERVAEARFHRSPRRRFKLRHPFGQDRRLLDRAVLHSALFYLVSIHGRLLHRFFDPSQQKPVTYSPPMQQRIPNSVLNPSPPEAVNFSWRGEQFVGLLFAEEFSQSVGPRREAVPPQTNHGAGHTRRAQRSPWPISFSSVSVPPVAARKAGRLCAPSSSTSRCGAGRGDAWECRPARMVAHVGCHAFPPA